MESASDTPGAGPLLLATKFHAPQWRREYVSRRRLVDVLRRGSGSKLTLISAPAGFGKTTLLAEWLADEATARAVSWVSLDQSDNDPALFWTYVIAALHAHEPTLGERALALLRALHAPPIESVLTSLINELSTSPRKFLLVLDDMHAIENRAIHEAIGYLLDHLPPQMRLVVTTRADPPLNLSRLRVRGELNELRAADLRFTPDEASAFLNDFMGLRLTDTDVRALEGRAEGWIAGLQLAGLSIRDHEDVPGFIQSFAGDHRYIVDYLLEEVLQRQSEETRSFLLQTAILDRLNGPLCDAVTGQRDGAARLVALERGNFFLVPLDSTRNWFRYHHLFSDVLKARLLAERPEEVASLHLRASAWFEQQGATGDAIGHALAAGANERAADLIELAATGMRKTRQEVTLLAWLKEVPDEEIARRPVLSTVYAGVLLSNGIIDRVDAWLRNGERWLGLMQDANGDTPAGMHVVDFDEFVRLPGSIAIYRAGMALASGNVPSTEEHARSALQVIPEDDHLYRGAAAALLGLASWANGELETAYTSFAEGMASLGRAGYILDTLGGSIALADLRILQGRLPDAMGIYQRGVRLAADHGLRAPRGLADMYVGMSELHREWNDLDAAGQNLAQSQTLGETAGFPQNPYRWRVALAKIRANLGDLDGAIVLLDEAEQRYVDDMFPNVRPIPALRARVWIAQGRLDDAFAWARERRLSSDDEVSYLGVFEHVTLARILLAHASRDRSMVSFPAAMELLERLQDAADLYAWTGSLIEILVLQSLGHRQQGSVSAALASLERALSLAAPGGYVRVFADEGEPMRRLLLELSDGAQVGNAQRVLRSWGTSERAAPGLVDGAGLVESLTPREIEILRLIAAGLRNQEIADRLYISLPTVKRHVANAYGKLGVTHRTEAIARANALGLL